MKKYIVDLSKKDYKELITCKKCKYYRFGYNGWDICAYFDKPMNDDDYCSKGKKKRSKE